MKTSEVISQNNEYVKELEKRIRLNKQSKEEEYEKVKSANENNIENLKKIGEDQFIQHVKLNDERLLNTTKAYEDRLSEYKENYEKTKQKLENETESIKSSHRSNIDNIRQKNLEALDFKNIQGREEQEKLQNNFKLNTDELVKTFNIDRNQLEANAREKILAMSSTLNQKAFNDEKAFQSELEQQAHNHIEEIANQRQNFRGIIDKKESDFKRMENEKSIAQKNELESLDNQFKNAISQKNSDFKLRYEAMAKEHDTILNELKAHLDSDVKKMLEENANQKRIIASKNDDNFYKVETLSPKITENEKDVIISVPIAEHEKENLMLIASDRNVRISLSRKFNDKFEDAEGNLNKATRSEIISKDFTTKDILSSKSITQKYENGVMNFRIMKR